MTNSKTAATQARQGLKRLKAALRAASSSPAREKSIHDLRVAIRRFKQVLRVYAGQFERTRKMKRALSGLMDLCGAARNCDVALAVLETAGVPAGRALKRDLKKRRAEATRGLAHELKNWRAGSLVRRWNQWLTPAPEKKAGEPPAPPGLSREFLKSGKAAAAAGAAFGQMHQFRLLVKKTRYAAEILGAPAPQIELLRGLQDRLGAINDCVTTADLIAALKLEPAETRRIKTALNRLAVNRAAEFRVYWRARFASRKAAGRRNQ